MCELILSFCCLLIIIGLQQCVSTDRFSFHNEIKVRLPEEVAEGRRGDIRSTIAKVIQFRCAYSLSQTICLWRDHQNDMMRYRCLFFGFFFERSHNYDHHRILRYFYQRTSHLDSTRFYLIRFSCSRMINIAFSGLISFMKIISKWQLISNFSP